MGRTPTANELSCEQLSTVRSQNSGELKWGYSQEKRGHFCLKKALKLTPPCVCDFVVTGRKSVLKHWGMGQKIIDISPMLSEETAVFPGDKLFSREVTMDFSKNDHLVLSSISSTVHIGAHADAPSHYHPDGESIEKRDLSLYMGPCQVVQVPTVPGQRISVEDLGDTEIVSQRVLFKTQSFPNPNYWNSDFCSLSSAVVELLAAFDVLLVGVDTPSVDPESSKDLEAHNMIYSKDMAILEGIVLEHVEPGVYELVALPLRIRSGDASPVRAVLIQTIY